MSHVCICQYVIYTCMYSSIQACMNVFVYVCKYVNKLVCTYACMYVRMHAFKSHPYIVYT